MSNSSRSELEPLVTAIHTTNHAWKLSQKWGDSFHALANSLVDRKARLQTELLRHHHDRVYLQRDSTSEAEAGEPIFGVLLDPPEPYRDAAYLPVRVARSYLSAAELQRFTRDTPIEPVESATSNEPDESDESAESTIAEFPNTTQPNPE